MRRKKCHCFGFIVRLLAERNDVEAKSKDRYGDAAVVGISVTLRGGSPAAERRLHRPT